MMVHKSPFGFKMVLGAVNGNQAQIMKIGDKVKKEKHDGDESDPGSTEDLGEQETHRRGGDVTPVANEGASASSGPAPTAVVKNEEEEKDATGLTLPPWDVGAPKKKSRTGRSSSRTSEHSKDEEKDAEGKAQKRQDEERAADAQRAKDADSAGYGEMLTYTDSMFDELAMETQLFDQKYKGEDHPTPLRDKVASSSKAGSKVAIECVEVPSTPTDCSGLSTPIQQQKLNSGQTINKVITSPLSQGSKRKRRRESRGKKEEERLSEERICQRARDICRSEKDTEPKSTILKKMEEIGKSFERNFFEWHLLAVRYEQLKHNMITMEDGKLPPNVKPFQPHRRQMRDFQEKWHKTLEKEVTLSVKIEQGATLLEVNQRLQAFQEQIYFDCQKQALTMTMSKLKAACSAETITNEILHIEYDEDFETPTYKEARKKATLAIGEKEMMYTRWKVREVLQSKLLSNEQKEEEELDFRKQIHDVKDPKKAMEWLYEKNEGELPQAVEYATKKTEEQLKELQDQSKFNSKWKNDNDAKNAFNQALGTQIGLSQALLGYSTSFGENFIDPQDKGAGKGKGKGAKSKDPKGKQKGGAKGSKSSKTPNSWDTGEEGAAKAEKEKGDTPEEWDSGKQSTYPKGKKWKKPSWKQSWEDSEWDVSGKWSEKKDQKEKKWSGKQDQDASPNMANPAEDQAESWEWAKQDWGTAKKNPPPPPLAPHHSSTKRGRSGGTY